MAGHGDTLSTANMALHRMLLALVSAWLWLSPSMAQPLPAVAAALPASAASAASAPVVSPPMSVIGEWQGPFQQTKILKLLDAEDGVACYLYVPSNVPSNTVCSGRDACAIHYPSGIGSMSCVKVREPRAAPKTAPKAAPKR